jgi:ATP-dependent RNA helicase DDX23/PRP28
MDLIFDDEFNAPNEVPKIPIKKNPDLNNSKNTIEFLSKEDREKIHKSEEQKAQDEKKQKELQSVEHKKIYLSLRGKDRRKDHNERRRRSRSREKEFEKKGSSSNESKEIEAIKVKFDFIKSYYLGANKEKKKLIKPSEKFKNIFNFEWDASEDTSNDINPLYSKRLEPQLLFGRGFKAGIDIKEQKRQSQTYNELLLKRDMIENDKESKDKKSERIKDKNDGKFSWSEKIRGLGEDNIHWSKKKLPEMTERDWRIFREDQDIIIKGGRVPNPLRGWDEGNLPGFILNAIKTAGYKMPTSIQMQGIPIGLEKRDMIGLAPTGSGKSAAFLIPLIVYLSNLPPLTEDNAQDGPYAMILAPSRELALQIFEEFNKFSKNSKLRAVCVVGGVISYINEEIC